MATGEDASTLQNWLNAAPYVCMAISVWYVRNGQSKAAVKIDNAAAATQLKVGSESDDIQTRIVALQSKFQALQDDLPQIVRKEIAAPMIKLHSRLDQFESSVRSTLTAAGLKWDQEYTVIPANKPKDKP